MPSRKPLVVVFYSLVCRLLFFVGYCNAAQQANGSAADHGHDWEDAENVDPVVVVETYYEEESVANSSSSADFLENFNDDDTNNNNTTDWIPSEAIDTIGHAFHLSPEFEDPVNRFNQIIENGVIAVATVSGILTILNIVIPLAIMRWKEKNPYQPIKFDTTEDGRRRRPRNPDHRKTCGGYHYQYKWGAIVYTFFYVCIIFSGVVFVASLEFFVDDLNEWIDAISWGFALRIVEALGISILIFTTLLLAFMWLQVLEMKRMIYGTYQQLLIQQQQQQQENDNDDNDAALMVDEKQSSSLAFLGERHYVSWDPRLVEAMFRCSFALLFLSMLLSLICLLVAISMVGTGFIVVNTCNVAADSVSGFCLDLQYLRLPRLCSKELIRRFCNDWSNLSWHGMLWSGFFVFILHFYLVAATSIASHQRRSIPALLASYNHMSHDVQLLLPSEGGKDRPPEGPECPLPATNIHDYNREMWV